MITCFIERLIAYGVKKELMGRWDVYAVRNQLYELLQIEADEIPEVPDNTDMTITQILSGILDYCVENEIIPDGSITQKDLIGAKIMGYLMPRQSEVADKFYRLYEKSKEAASEWFYTLCSDSNYIQTERIACNQYWKSETDFGHMEITVNLSKPEKDPREIAKAKLLPQTGYPKCLLCAENIGYSGNLNHPARQNLRAVPLKIGGEDWFLQYSPYVYYNEHCIVFNKKHIPMKVSGDTFKKLLEFIEFLPHYFIGSNADLPIVGGSILSHDHFQGGRHVFPMEMAGSHSFYTHQRYNGINVSLVKWPMSVIRMSGTDKDALSELSTEILNSWRNYSDESREIMAFSGNIPHNTITPIARKNKAGLFELDLVLRNNRTTTEHPLGIFHPSKRLHNIKKENIGLIEVMGLAILPGRLNEELRAISCLLAGLKSENDVDLDQHKQWIDELLLKYKKFSDEKTAYEAIKKETGIKFMEVLWDSGVFKADKNGIKGFHEFMSELDFVVV